MKLLGLLLCQRCFSFLPVLPPSSHLKKHQKGFVGISPRLWASSQEETNASEAREAAMQEDKEWYDRFMEEIGNDIDSYAVEASAAMPSKIKIEDRENADDLGVDVDDDEDDDKPSLRRARKSRAAADGGYDAARYSGNRALGGNRAPRSRPPRRRRTSGRAAAEVGRSASGDPDRFYRDPDRKGGGGMLDDGTYYSSRANSNGRRPPSRSRAGRRGEGERQSRERRDRRYSSERREPPRPPPPGEPAR